MAASSYRRPTFEQVTSHIAAETLGLRCNLDVIALRDWLLYVAKETGNVGAQDLGRSLGIKEAIISDVMRDYRESCEQRYRVIIHWTERFRHKATVRNLIEAVWSENGLNDAATAESMSRKIQELEARIKQDLDEMERYAQVRKESKIPILLPGWREAHRQLNLAEYSQVHDAKKRIAVQDERIKVLENDLQEERRKSTVLEQSLHQLHSDVKTLQSQVTEIEKSRVQQPPQATGTDRPEAPCSQTKVVPKRKAPPPPVQLAENRRPGLIPRLRKAISCPDRESLCSSDGSLNSTSQDSERRKSTILEHSLHQLHSNVKTLQAQKSRVQQLPQATGTDRPEAPCSLTKMIPKRKAPPPPVQLAENSRSGSRPRLRKGNSCPEGKSLCSSGSSLNSTSQDSERRKAKTYTYAELQTNPGEDKMFPDDVDRTHLEQYLSKVEFQMVFGMSRLQFLQVPIWKQAELKKKYLLF